MEHVLSGERLEAGRRHPDLRETLDSVDLLSPEATAQSDFRIEDDRVVNAVKSFVTMITIN